MRILVITKRTLIIAAIVAVFVIAAVIIALSFTDGNATATTGATVQEEYELTVMAGRKKELPVYSVSRDDKKIALTIDAAWEDDKTDFIFGYPRAVQREGHVFSLRVLGGKVPR